MEFRTRDLEVGPSRKMFKLNEKEQCRKDNSDFSPNEISTMHLEKERTQDRNDGAGDGEPLHLFLHIDHILENVLSRLDLENLKSSSLVCKTWSTKVRNLIVKDYVVKITQAAAADIMRADSGESKGFIKHNIFGHSVNLMLQLKDSSQEQTEVECHQFIGYSEAESLILYLSGKQTVIKQLTLDFDDKDIPKLWALMTRTSNHHRGLNLQIRCLQPEPLPDPSQCNTGGVLPLDIEFDTTPFPNLNSLTGDFSTQNHFLMLKVIKKLLINSPNLSEINCKMSSNHHEMFNALRDHPEILQSLKSLSNVSINQEEMEMLRRKNLPLENLSFRLYSGFRVREMGTFLSSLASTLKVLQIDYVNLPNVPEPFRSGKDLSNLTSLTLEKFYGSIYFISEMPNLKALVLINVNLSVALHDDASRYCNCTSNLKRLEIFGGQGSNGRFLLPAIYYHIVRFFPQLMALRIEYMTDTTLKILVRGLSHLEELFIPNGVYSDEILICKGGYKGEDACSLADLKSLRKLLLQSIRITDFGVQEGIMHYPELRSLSIDSPVISDASLQSICDNENLHNLEFRNCYRFSLNAIDNMKKKWEKRKRLIISQA